LSKNTKLAQLSLGILAAVLVVIVLIAPARKKKLLSAKPAQAVETSIEQIISNAKADLSPSQVSSIATWELALNNARDEDKFAYMDTLAMNWIVLKQPFIAGHYYKQISTVNTNVANLVKSARQYYSSFNSSGNDEIKSTSLKTATELFEKALSLEPDNQEIKLDLALCFVENKDNPMQGIMLLRELIKANPQNENALFNLGVLSMRSGQYEKAIERFEEILAISEKRHELLLYIADSYVQLGEKDKAIVYFSRFKSKTQDKGLIDEIDSYIEKLKE